MCTLCVPPLLCYTTSLRTSVVCSIQCPPLSLVQAKVETFNQRLINKGTLKTSYIPPYLFSLRISFPPSLPPLTPPLFLLGVEEEVYQLDVDLSSLHFTHHPLFSVEHVMAARLQQACDQLKKRQRNEMAEYHSEKVLLEGVGGGRDEGVEAWGSKE